MTRILDYPVEIAPEETNWTLDQQQWTTVRQLGTAQKGDWQLLLQNSKTEPENFRVFARHHPQDMAATFNDSFTCEAFDGSFLIMSKGGMMRPHALPEGLLDQAKTLAEGFRTVSVGAAKSAAADVKADIEARFVAEASAELKGEIDESFVQALRAEREGRKAAGMEI